MNLLFFMFLPFEFEIRMTSRVFFLSPLLSHSLSLYKCILSSYFLSNARESSHHGPSYCADDSVFLPPPVCKLVLLSLFGAGESAFWILITRPRTLFPSSVVGKG